MNQTELDDFLTYYYQRPSPDRAVEALGCAATATWVTDPSSRPIAAYVFRRLAELHPELVEGYRKVHAAVRDAGQDFVGELIASIDSRTPGNVLERPIRTPTDNDLHWAEFCLTGDVEAVRRLIDVLARPDRVRERLEAWLASEPSLVCLPGTARRRRKALARLRALGLVCDSVGRSVESREDLDCLVMLDGLQPSRERYERMKRALPIRLAADDVTYLGVKATAVWSLAGYAGRHACVLEVCRTEARRRAGPVRLLLRQIVAAAGGDVGTEAEDGAARGAATVSDLSAGPETGAPSLVGRAILAVALMLGFYGLALGVAGTLVAIPLAELYYLRLLTGKLAFFCLAGAGIILWAIMPRPDRFLPPGPPLTEQEQPRLFVEFRRIARDVGQSMPLEVYLDPQVNAWVAHRGGAMGIGVRRVMALGLPLLQALSVAELRAVLAHEFGHYHGGDTRLGPWVYKTRLAIVRTLQGLEGHTAGLQVIFLWYARLFVRVTHAVSRAQELAADRLAARVAGAEALASGLRAVHGASAAFSAYLSSELGPVLAAGLRPPIADGFARFLAAPGIATQVRRTVEAEIAAAPGGVYDTNPPLRERIAAVQDLPPGDVGGDARAISLLDRLPELERDLLVAVTGNAAFRSCPVMAWDNAVEQFWTPTWQRARAEHSATLRGVTPGSLPNAAGRLVELGRTMAGGSPADGEARALATTVLGSAFAIALHERGWTIEVPAGSGARAMKDGHTIEPFNVLRRLVNGELSPQAWREQCVALDIVDLDLGALRPALSP